MYSTQLFRRAENGDTLADRGLDLDEAHLTISTEFDYSLPGPIFRGYKAFNLTGLMFLDAFLREVVLTQQSNP